MLAPLASTISPNAARLAARFLLASGMVRLVAAPSKLQRPSGDRVKTDIRDAGHLARLHRVAGCVRARRSPRPRLPALPRRLERARAARRRGVAAGVMRVVRGELFA
jgi:hypothetical protein